MFNVGTFSLVTISVQRNAVLPFFVAVLFNVLIGNSIVIYIYTTAYVRPIGRLVANLPAMLELQVGAFAISAVSLIAAYLLWKVGNVTNSGGIHEKQKRQVL